MFPFGMRVLPGLKWPKSAVKTHHTVRYLQIRPQKVDLFFYTNNNNSTQVLNYEIQPHSLKNKLSFAYSKRLRFKTIMLENTKQHNQDNANVFVNQPEWVYYCPIALNV